MPILRYWNVVLDHAIIAKSTTQRNAERLRNQFQQQYPQIEDVTIEQEHVNVDVLLLAPHTYWTLRHDRSTKQTELTTGRLFYREDEQVDLGGSTIITPTEIIVTSHTSEDDAYKLLNEAMSCI